MVTETKKYIMQISTLITGTTMANVIPILVVPILSRMYSPADFGVIALFISLTAIVGSISNGRYELAIILPRDQREAIALTLSSVLIALSLALVLLPPVILLNAPLAKLLNNENIGLWLYLLPLSIFIFGVNNPLNYYHVRKERYKAVTAAKIARALSLAIVQLYGGVMGWGGSGLILGFLVASLVESLVLFRRTRPEWDVFRSINMNEMKTQMKRYIRFPKFSAWGAASNTLSTNLIDIVIPAIFSTVMLGYYALINRILGMPLKMIGNSISQVYFQKAAEQRNEKGDTWPVFKQTFLMLIGISLPLFMLIFLFIEDLFGIVFGEEWAIAGSYAKILLPLFAVRFIVSPLSVTCSVYEKQKVAFIWQLSLLLSIIIIFIATQYNNYGFDKFLNLFTWLSSALYLIMLAFVIRLSLGKHQ